MMVNMIGLHHDGQYDWLASTLQSGLPATSKITMYVQVHVWTLNFELWNKGIHPCSQTKQGSNSQCSESSESQEVETSYTGQKIVVQEPENQFGSINKIHLTINVL